MGIFSIFGSGDRAPAPAMTASRREDRTVDELVGLCRGILADGDVSTQEAMFLQDWLRRNAHCAHRYPFSILLHRLADALRDGVVDEDEERELIEAIVKLVGGEANGEFESQSASLSSSLPLDNPAPSIDHASPFVVTGTFAFGPRASVMEAISSRGGLVASSVSKKVRFLVIGEVGSRDWIHSSYGRKIEKAVELRDAGVPIAIVSERHWASHL